ncbi:MAG: hypothetical protein ACYC61_00605 [Isosphaeraceae bacterium]
MNDVIWRENGPVLTSDLAGRTWRLELDDPHPGLTWSDSGDHSRILALHHVAAAGRRDPSAFAGASLVSWARHGARLEAAFVPPNWPGLNVRAAWSPTADRTGFDLEVQVWMTSTAVLRRLEITVSSLWWRETDSPPACRAYQVEPRDAHSAALSYDGREPAEWLQSLTTLPVPSTSSHLLAPRRMPVALPPPGSLYVEMVQPDDCARRIIGEPRNDRSGAAGASWTGYALFGHDLEKGVVLRGRIRGCWIESPQHEDEAARLYERFLSEPPPLGP